jgi:putative membrane protein
VIPPEVVAVMHWHDGGGGMWAGAWVFMGLFWLVLIVALAFLAARMWPGGRGGLRGHGPSPLDILDERFARGEVDLEAYRAQRAALEEALARTPRK